MTQTITGRLAVLANHITKGGPAYFRAVEAGRDPSPRMWRWLDEYNGHRGTADWAVYCKTFNLDPRHRALDLLA